VDNLKTVNIHDYPEEVIDALAASNTPQRMLESARKCDAFVAVENGTILGIAMLDGNRIKRVFTHTQMQRRGIGRALMSHVEALAEERRIPELIVDSSITAVGFYSKCGYEVIRKVNKPFRGIENIIFEMSKNLNTPESGGKC
jgi:GNAT superfamily N-acetyltransferase